MANSRSPLPARRKAAQLARSGAYGPAIDVLIPCLVDHPDDINLARQFRDLLTAAGDFALAGTAIRRARIAAPGNSEFLIPWPEPVDLSPDGPGTGEKLARFWICAAGDESQQVRAGVFLRGQHDGVALDWLLSRMMERRCAILEREGRAAVDSYFGFLDGLYNFFWGSSVVAAKIAALELLQKTATPPLMQVPAPLAPPLEARYRTVLTRLLRQPGDQTRDRFKELIVQDPEVANFYFGLSEYFHGCNQYGLAATGYRRADLICPENRSVWHRLAHALANANRPREALAVYLRELGMTVEDGVPEKMLTGRIGVDEGGALVHRGADNPWVRKADPTFTFIVCAYKYPEYLAQSVETLLNQTYRNVEIILINNGGGDRIGRVIEDAARRDSRVRPLTYEVEQYSKDDPLRFVAVCLNDALAMAKGDFVVDMNDDDYVDETYAEKMVALFQGDTACIAASGGINRVGAKGEYRGNYDFYNARPTYTPGILVTFSNFLGGNTKEFHRFLYGAYGLTFSYRRDVLQKVGGFHRDTDNSIMFGYLPFGTVGSDPSARFNWRVHDEQLSKRMGEGGHVGLQYSADFWRARAPARRWELFGAEVATRFDARMRSYIATLALSAGLTGGPGVHGSMEKLRDAVLAFGPELENSPALLDFDKATGRI